VTVSSSEGLAHAPLVRVQDLSLTLPAPGGPRPILADISFGINRGEALGLVGESGSGKSMTARSLIRLLPAGAELTGTIELGSTAVLDLPHRELRELRARRVAMVFQDPHAHINPVRTIGDFLTEGMRAVGGLSERAANERALELLDAVHIDAAPTRMRQYPHELSGGMLQRVMIAAAIAGDPELLIADEPTTALDVTTQSDVMATLMELRADREMTLLFITHDLELAAATCDRTIVLYAGRVAEERPSAVLHRDPRHPYTIGLLRARPTIAEPRTELAQLRGRPAEAVAKVGCAFAPRCDYATDECRTVTPPEVRVTDGRAFCHHLDAVTARRVGSTEIQARHGARDATAATRRDDEFVLETRHLCKVYRSRRDRQNRVAVQDISLTLRRAGAVGIVGESGSGKTTIAKMLVGLESPTAGEIGYGGSVASTTQGRAERRQRARHIQLVFQNPYTSLDPHQTVGAAISEVLRIHFTLTRDQRDHRVTELLESVGLDPELTKRRPRNLSGGQRQRVAIARALACQPATLVLDEAVSALDISVQAQVLNLLNQLRRRTNTALIFISHDLAAVAQVADYIYVMDRGAVVEEGTAAQVLTAPRAPQTKALIDSIPREGWNPSHRGNQEQSADNGSTDPMSPTATVDRDHTL
jgi:peptide/nickel transport system ATP-binding protein